MASQTRRATHTGREGRPHCGIRQGLCARLDPASDLHLVRKGSPARRRSTTRLAGRQVRRSSPSPPRITTCPPSRHRPADRRPGVTQVETLRRNCAEFGIRHSMGDIEQGIVHVVGPVGLTQPGMTIVCGDGPQPRRIRGVGDRYVGGRARAGRRRCRCDRSRPWAVSVDGRLPDGVSARTSSWR